MIPSRGLAPAGFLLALLLAPATASADIPPPAGYVEKCTVDQAQARTGVTCEMCGDAYHGDREACANKFAATTTMSRECQTSGASTWDEVWCDSAKPLSAEDKAASEKVAAEQAAPTGTEDKGQKGCGCVASDPEPAGGFALLALGVGLLGLGRARRRSFGRPLSFDRGRGQVDGA